MKIYAADDERIMLEGLMDSINKVAPDAEIKGFRKASELLEAVKSSPCDITFLDIQMPEKDGITLAKELISIKEDMNIIFVTGYDRYKGEAMDLYASGYIMKPATPERVQDALNHLRYPAEKVQNRCRAITFGNFALYVDGKPVTFHRRKSMELLAYLVDRGGTTATRQELTLMLFEDETHSRQAQKNLDNAYRTLLEDLKAVHAEDILYKGSDGLAVNRNLLDADLFDYQQGAESLYRGQYMAQYSWGEYFKKDTDEK